jgi:uncharacterized SAM-dependent methyltransferase
VKPGDKPRAQVVELLLHVARELGAVSDRELAELCEVSPDNIAHWKSGGTQELKPQTLDAIKERLSARLATLRERARAVDGAHDAGLVGVEIEEGSGPSALQRQLAERVRYDYLGHRFLYFEPQGALAWESLMRGGYDQSCWLAGIDACAAQWLDDDKGPLARALGVQKGVSRKGAARGLDVISLGPGEAGKEALLLAHAARAPGLAWIACALVDVSIPLLLTGARSCRAALAEAGDRGAVMPFCGDFEEGALSFVSRLPSSERDRTLGVRVVCMLGNVFGNVRDEQILLEEKLSKIVRAGDFLWLEVALRLDKIENDPVFRMTLAEAEASPSAAETARRLLLEGPYRRFEAASRRKHSEVRTRVFVRDGDETCSVPGSCNFVHDLVIEDERRSCTMLYSRRYDLKGLTQFLEQRGFDVEAVVPVEDSSKRSRVAHVLARRR